MKGEDRDSALLLYIKESIDRIEQYTEHGRESFLTDAIVQDATLRRLETLADAASRLSNDLKARHPDIPWRDIYGFRNVVAHGYLQLELRRCWNTIEVHLPPLKTVIEDEISRGGLTGPP